MNKVAITLGAIVLISLAVVSWIVLRPNQVEAPSSGTTIQPAPSANTPETTTPQLDPASSEVAVEIKDFAYTPANLTVKKGTTVVWTNQDSINHNVVSDADAPAGGPPSTADLLSKGQSFSFMFDTVGTFRYHCTPHPNMKGVIEVVE